ncbi:condensation-domain-containing protein [Mollisia scopiformis]|uniref:Condensation-domain-containing protein n=1 Tax=Mollisia scopiformis TaxID=149040 RepID=A0A194XTY3_MOLSC|nr:condensation-domain-containing protein [Mollisia scopiformis]KUJ23668.1 condensation-domain-containing protein [Mollisia scopiformis]
MRNRQAIQRWVKECQETFEEIVQRLAGIKSETCYTLSDFPLLPMSYDGLHRMMTKTLPEAGVTQDNIEDIYPCAPLQEGLLISQLKTPSLYHVYAMFEVCSSPGGPPVDRKRLASAWQKVVDRHAALRTVFVDSVCKGAIFNQVVLKKVDSGLITIHCEETEAVEKLSSVSILNANYTKQPRLPHQSTICETTSGKIYLKTEVNHAVIDGTSANIILHDLTAAYHGELPDGPGPLFSNYIAYIKRRAPGESINFWKAYLEGASICNFPVQIEKLPKDRQVNAITMNFERFPALQDLGKKLNVTIANIMSAAWAFCLREYTKSDDVSFGYLTSGRDVPVHGVQGALGAFINILVCRVKFAKRATLDEIFKAVQNDYLQSLEHQHVSLAQVQHDLMSGRALFNTAVSIQSDRPSENQEKNHIIFKSILAHDPSEYSVTLNIRTLKGEEGVVIRYWTDVMSPDQAEGLSNMLGTVLDYFINKPDQLVEELDLSQYRKVPRPQLLLGAAPTNEPSIIPPPIIMSETQLRNIISECVREVMGQILSSEAFPAHAQGVRSDTVSVVKQETIHSMIDYAQLTTSPPPRPQMARASSANTIASIMQLSPVEQKLLSVWSELLQISKESIKKDDSFFKLGGDSIVAMQMVGMARDEDLALTVANIFTHPTFAEMAAVIRMAEEAQSPSSVAVARDYIEAHNSRSQAIQNAFYQRYSLLEAQDVDTFLQQNICPKVRSFRGGIVDVFPVTDFQALAITGALMESKWMLNYFYLEADGDINLKILKSAIARMVNAFDILRTVFTPYNNRFFQVVLRKLQPSFSVHDTEDLESFTTALQQQSRKNGPRPGESYLQFTVAQQKNSNRHRIIMRISHAQYDGVCLPSILSALQSGYEGHSIPETPDFSAYVRDAARQTTDEHYLYWKSLLKGSAMTEIVRRRGPNYSRGTEAPTNLKRVVRMPSLASEGITAATIIKAAWSLVLAKWSAQSDVVFGNVISGRNAHVPGVDRIIGPCVNMIPVRVNFQEDWTVLDLLHSIQDQQVTAMPYESLGFREIIKHCTSWPDWTNFSTVCQHQNIQRQTQIQLGDNEYTLGAIGSQEDFADLTVLSTPQEGNQIEISLIFTSNSGITLPFAEAMFEALCETAVSFPKDPMASLPPPPELSLMPQRTLDEVVTSAREDMSLDPKDLSRDELSTHSAMLTMIWRQILGEKTGQVTPIALEASFFELGGDIIGIAQVGSLLEQEGVKMGMEDLVDHPKMIEQISLIAAEVRKEKEALAAEAMVASVQDAPELPKKGLKGILEKSVKLAKKIRRRRDNEGHT